MKTVIALLLVGLTGGGFYYAKFFRGEDVPNFRTAVVERGELLLTINASGTLEPEEVVDVGAQVLGRIEEFGKDLRSETDPKFKDKHVDFNSPVVAGMLLARIDPTIYQATYNETKAGHDRAKADLKQLEARLAQTKVEWERAQRLRDVNLSSVAGSTLRPGQPPTPATVRGISDADYVMAKANYEVALANVDVGRAIVGQQQAAVDLAKTNLDFTEILCPVSGTIIARRMAVGQTVVPNLNAPSLFLIAKDLRRMEIWTSVNEADIGRIKVGMPVQFKVDAFPDDTFRGEVSQVRLDAQMTQNVVIYTVVVTISNDDLKLLPYLSADVRFEVDRRDDVLLVPNAALRYRPRPELMIPPPESMMASAWLDDADDETESARHTVWVKQGNFVYPMEVEIGITDGSQTEIVAGGLTEGLEVVLGESRDEPVVAEANNPFAPPRFRGTKKKDKDKQS